MPPNDKLQQAALRRAFRMPAVQSMLGRKTTITNAFVSSIIPVVYPTPDEILEALKVLGMSVTSVECIYCGGRCNAWDHLRPIVVKRRPTGYISEIANLVPACQPCNSSKGNTPWREWIGGAAPQSPKSRGIADLESRITRLGDYERWRKPRRIDFVSIVGEAAYAEYWAELDRVMNELAQSQAMADKLRAKILDASSTLESRPESSST